MQIIIFGKQSFVSKTGKQCYIIHYGYKMDSVEGLAVEHKFVDGNVYNKVMVNKNYNIVFGDSFGRSIISDLVEVAQ